MPPIAQWEALGVLTKPRLLEIAGELGLGLPGRLLKSELVGAIAQSTTSAVPAHPRAAEARRAESDLPPSATLTKADLIEAVAAEAGVTKRDAEAMINAALASMVESLRADESIEVRGFGNFGTRQCGQRIGRNPRTRAAVHVPAKRVCYFKPGKMPRLLPLQRHPPPGASVPQVGRHLSEDHAVEEASCQSADQCGRVSRSLIVQGLEELPVARAHVEHRRRPVD